VKNLHRFYGCNLARVPLTLYFSCVLTSCDAVFSADVAPYPSTKAVGRRQEFQHPMGLRIFTWGPFNDAGNVSTFLSLPHALIGHPLPTYLDTELHRPNIGDV
jgi:hypothetical protein